MAQRRRILWLAVSVATSVLIPCRAATAQPLNCHPWDQVPEFKGSVSMTGSGTASIPTETYQANQSFTITFDVGAPNLTCGEVIPWTSGVIQPNTGTLTFSVNDRLTIPCLPGDPRGTSVFTYQGSGSVPGGEELDLAFAAGIEPDGTPRAANTYALFGGVTVPITATTTDCNGRETTLATTFQLGPSSAGLLLFKNISLPGSVQTLSGSLTEHGNPLQTFLQSFDWQFNWSITPIQDFDVILTGFPGSDWTTWRPTAGLTESDTGDQNGLPNLLYINAAVVEKRTGEIRGDLVPDRITFTLKDVSKEPGVAMNWPPQAQSVSTPDLTFDPLYHPASLGFIVNSDNTSVDLDPTKISGSAGYPVFISPHDWGAWATLNVTIVVGTNTINGHFQGDSTTDILLPKRQSASQHVADIWKTQHNVPLSTPDSDDSEVDPQGRSDCVGDGFTVYEEYRGFMENGKHIEGDPNSKDFFIVNEIGADAEPGIFLFTELSRLTVHKDVQEIETQTTATEFGDIIADSQGNESVAPVDGRPLMNFNHSQGAHTTDQHGVLVRTCDKLALSLNGTIAGVINIDGGQTIWKNRSDTIVDRAQPATTRFVCVQGRDAPGSINPSNTHGGVITTADAVLQYDVAVAHELMHSVGVLHHGDLVVNGQDTEGIVSFDLLWPQTPKNTTDQPIFQLHGQNVQLLDERTEGDYALTVFQAVKNQLSQCLTIVNNPSAYPSDVVERCRSKLFFAVNDPGSTFKIYIGLPHGKHSGNDQCLMRYPFAQAYPSAFDATVFYVVPDGTEPLGFGICSSPAGTGVNDPNRGLPPLRPQPRYFDAHTGRGACKTWLCVSDHYPPQADSQ